MIATHNSFTYLEPTQWWAKPFAPWWRCQDKQFRRQIKDGVKFLDIRIAADKKQRWTLAHGAVTLKYNRNIYALLHELKLKKIYCRLVLEKGDKNDEQLFINEFAHAPESDGTNIYKTYNVTQLIIKKRWRTVREYRSFIVFDNSYVPLHSDKPWYKQLPNIIKMPFITIRQWAKRNNPQHPIAGDVNSLFFYDFYDINHTNNEPKRN